MPTIGVAPNHPGFSPIPAESSGIGVAAALPQAAQTTQTSDRQTMRYPGPSPSRRPPPVAEAIDPPRPRATAPQVQQRAQLPVSPGQARRPSPAPRQQIRENPVPPPAAPARPFQIDTPPLFSPNPRQTPRQANQMPAAPATHAVTMPVPPPLQQPANQQQSTQYHTSWMSSIAPSPQSRRWIYGAVGIIGGTTVALGTYVALKVLKHHLAQEFPSETP